MNHLIILDKKDGSTLEIYLDDAEPEAAIRVAQTYAERGKYNFVTLITR